ncbi:ABC transporter ATP-binding protein [Clostridium sp. Marseille-P299]|uniref:ABC transporter ATP-binding protein n=1 Tax=Clostridium sp. Marseille-P299 TaxID=1805477 RepID=UPI0008352E36|nr:ABC transporter ATP-binding protein [Clostridium sp. Marseille-P299]
MLELIHVSKHYKKVIAVKDLSFCIDKGEVFGIIGENGAGKSTTLSMIATLIKPEEGSILFEGKDIVKHPKVIRQSLGYVPQDIALYESLTGYDNILFWGRAYHVSDKLIHQRLAILSDMVGFSASLLNKKVKEYSGGMKRKLNIIAALLHQPKLVIFDEPTVGIDIRSRKQILKAILELKRNGTSVIFVGHHMDEIESICDRILVLKDGRSIYNGTMKEAVNRQTGKIPLEQLYMELMNQS